jgi:aryl-alcohol dehydrogenase-like predicted oxidoreductase
MKIALGTAQFGLNYGVSNKQGKTSKKQVLSILKYAHENNINFLDTAANYGNSEEVVGEVNLVKNWNIITKTISFQDDQITNRDTNKLKKYFNNSLKKLKKESIYGLLIHSCDDLFKPGGDKLFKEIENIRSSGCVEKIGVSVYNNNQIDRLLSEYDFDLVQLPISILDHRLIESGALEKIKDTGAEIHARSVFLQGILLMPLDVVPSYFLPIRKKLESLKNISQELNMSALELAFGFVNSISEIDKIIVGLNTVEQLFEIINAAQIQVKYSDFSELAVDNEDIVNPSLWRL